MVLKCREKLEIKIYLVRWIQNYMAQICGNKMKNSNNILKLATMKEQKMII
jgi:hypothetical protein